MALSAKFTADFTSLVDACDKADIKLKTLGDGAASVNQKLAKLGNEFSGVKVIQQATLMTAAMLKASDITELTDKELRKLGNTVGEATEKMKKLGVEVPPGFQKITDAANAIKPATDGAIVSFGKLVASFVTAQAIIGLLKEGFHDLVGFVGDSIKAAGDAEKAHVQLVAALRAQGTAIPSVISAYQGYAKELQRTTIFQDDAVEGAIALMVQIGNVMPRDMEKALKATTNLASGLGIDLETATRMVAKAAEGNVTALQKTGVVLDEATKKSGDFGKVLDAINEKFGGQAAALASTYQGRLAQLGNTWNDLEESIGRVITQNATVLKAFDLLNGVIDENTGELKDNQAVTNLVSDAVILTVKAFAEFARVLDLVQTGMSGIVLFARRGGQAIANLGIIALEAARGMALLHGDLGAMTLASKGIDDLRAAVKTLGEDNQKTRDGSDTLGNALETIGAKADALAKQLDETRGKTVKFKDDTDDLQDVTDRVFASLGLGSNIWNRHTKAVEAGGEAAKKAAKEYEELQQALIDLQDETDRVFAGILLGVNSRTVGNGAALFGPGQIRTPSIDGLFGPTGAVQNPQGGSFPAAGPAKIGSKKFSLPAGSGTSFADNLAAGIPNAIQAAIQGGGSKLEAAGSAVGSALFGKDSKATKLISAGLGKLFGPDSFMTKTLSDAVPVIGALIGPAIEGLGKLWGKVFGTAGRDAVRDFASKNGGFDALHLKLGALGADGEALWKSLTQGVGRNSPEQAKAAIEKVTAAFEAQRQKILAIQSQLDGVSGKLSHITTIGPGLQDALDKALNATNANDLNLALQGISDEIDKQQAKFNLVKSTIAKYGLSFTDAGKDFKQAQINETAQGLIEDFNTLTEAGFDTKTEVHGMSKELSQFAQDAKKAGVEVPEDMRKILQAAIDNGELFDENGKKITDLKDLGLTFGTTMETVMKHTIPDAIDKLTTVLEALAKFLKIDLPGAASDAASGINDAFSQVHLPDLSSPDFQSGFGGPKDQTTDVTDAATGGTITPFGLQYFASGSRGRVIPFVPRGTDTVPAMLTPGETVRTKSQENALQSQLASGGTTIDLRGATIYDGPSFERVLTQYMRKPGGGSDVLIDDVIRDKRGRGTKLKRKIG